jgi:hypothetical protein
MANYGYSYSSQPRKQNQASNIQTNDIDSGPWTTFHVEKFFNELEQLLKADSKHPEEVWHEEVKWLDNGNYIEVNINPFGSLRITTRKYIKDLTGKRLKLKRFSYLKIFKKKSITTLSLIIFLVVRGESRYGLRIQMMLWRYKL